MKKIYRAWLGLVDTLEVIQKDYEINNEHLLKEDPTYFIRKEFIKEMKECGAIQRGTKYRVKVEVNPIDYRTPDGLFNLKAYQIAR